MKDKHYGKSIAQAAKSFSGAAQGNCKDPEPVPGPGMECLIWWGAHIGGGGECGGLDPEGPLCPEEATEIQ